MGEVHLPDIKLKLWTAMREDLVRHIPELEETDILLCPICCRALKFEKFSLEHILPQQAVKHDPAVVREAIIKNERSGLGLLCSETLVVGGKPYANGCNSWKGRNFDGCLTDLLKPGLFPRRFSDAHIISFLVVGYLGLFRQFGYRVALTPGGLAVRNQFFNPRAFTKHLPITSQMVLRGEPHTEYKAETQAYWSDPVKIYVDGARGKATIVIRNYSVILSLSHDPTIPLATTLAYAPQKHVFRPDLRLAYQ
ncbi:hypothetical protein [Rhizobium leguminosarum]|uniref:hypothetical protein n=1 Tax=Rhizobium leguminosarum TaxID=384 RepID=UPI00103A9E17|nr:hypothetical protein [Rhizobium leguminosarum]TBZ06256.1 hypothetical protein E0H38_33130 [Rhizobium leguminosarum bv. viciae]